jgi:hypothetical protein
MKAKHIIIPILGLAGAYFIYTYFKKKKSEATSMGGESTPIGSATSGSASSGSMSSGSIPDKGQPKVIVSTPNLSSSTPSKSPFKPTLTNISASTDDRYVVKLTSGTLNFRLTPSTSGKIIGGFVNGQQIDARPSSAVSGWSEVLDKSGSFPIVIGYVSSKYLVKA